MPAAIIMGPAKKRAKRMRGESIRLPAMAELTVYEKNTCTTCRNLSALLAERGIDYDAVEYHVTGLSEDELRALLAKLGVPPREILREREPLVAELGLKDREIPDDELIALMAE